MKSFDGWRRAREASIAYLLDDVATISGYFWGALSPALQRADPRLFGELQTEIDSMLLSHARMQLETLPTQNLCGMTNQTHGGNDLPKEFADGYLDKLAKRVEALFQQALTPA